MPRIKKPAKKKESKPTAEELFKVLNLIVAEFDSDPSSVMCFDLNAIVYPAQELVKRWRTHGKD